MDSFICNPWHGCHKYSEGCKNCYVYRRDGKYGLDSSAVTKNSDFDLLIRKNRKGFYKIPSGSTVFLCMTSDFFIEEADAWRPEMWKMIKKRSDLDIIIITKRIVRFSDCIPNDWEDGYENVTIACTIENQKQCDIRFPVFNLLPIKHKMLICEPLLSQIDMRGYLNSSIESVTVGGESGEEARICDYDWVLDIRDQCMDAGVRFSFKQTGHRFKKGDRLYIIKRQFQHSQAKAANIDYIP